jgi:hypothetical protein
MDLSPAATDAAPAPSLPRLANVVCQTPQPTPPEDDEDDEDGGDDRGSGGGNIDPDDDEGEFDDDEDDEDETLWFGALAQCGLRALLR